MENFQEKIEEFVYLAEQDILTPEDKLKKYNLSQYILKNSCLLDKESIKKINNKKQNFKYFKNKIEQIIQKACEFKVILNIPVSLFSLIKSEKIFWNYFDFLNEQNAEEIKIFIEEVQKNIKLLNNLKISTNYQFWDSIENRYKNSEFSDNLTELYLKYAVVENSYKNQIYIRYSRLLKINNQEKIFDFIYNQKEDIMIKIVSTLFFTSYIKHINIENFSKENYNKIKNKIIQYIQKTENNIDIIKQLPTNLVLEYFLENKKNFLKKITIEKNNYKYTINNIQYIFFNLSTNKICLHSLKTKQIQQIEEELFNPIIKQDNFIKTMINVEDLGYEINKGMIFYYLLKLNKLKEKEKNLNIIYKAIENNEININDKEIDLFFEDWIKESFQKTKKETLLKFKNFLKSIEFKNSTEEKKDVFLNERLSILLTLLDKELLEKTLKNEVVNIKKLKI